MISFIAPAYAYYPILLPSLIAQNDPNWECICLHDTYNEQYVRWIDELNDPRIRLYFSKERGGKWGHPMRGIGVKEISNLSTLVVHTNSDNYYCPSFVKESRENIGTHIGVYCDCIHSHFDWELLYTELAHGKIDCGCIAVRSDIAREFGWQSMDFEADWHWIQEILKKYGVESFAKIHKPLFVHN